MRLHLLFFAVSFLGGYDACVSNIKQLGDIQLNSVQQFDEGSSESLDGIEITECHIGTVTKQMFSEFVNIAQLELVSNGIRHIEPGSFERLQKLRDFNLKGNRLKKLEAGVLKGLHNINRLHVQYNSLQSIDRNAFEEVNNLRDLSLARNKLGLIAPGTLARLQKLQNLDIRHNELRQVPEDVSKLGNLQQLNLRGNKITNLSEIASDSLSILDLTQNRITAVDKNALTRLPEVYILSLSSNGLTALPHTVGALKSLKWLNLHHNHLTTLPSGVRDLQLDILDVSHNKLHTIKRRWFSRTSFRRNFSRHLYEGMTKLVLSHNLISNIEDYAFVKLTNLKTLHLHNNLLKHLGRGNFRHLRELQHLSLASNRLEDIDWKELQLPSLNTIDISHNRLTVLPKNVLKASSKLTELKIDYNQIAVFNFATFFETHRRVWKFYLNYNNWNCSNLRSLKYLIQKGVKLDNHTAQKKNVYGIGCH